MVASVVVLFTRPSNLLLNSLQGSSSISSKKHMIRSTIVICHQSLLFLYLTCVWQKVEDSIDHLVQDFVEWTFSRFPYRFSSACIHDNIYQTPSFGFVALLQASWGLYVPVHSRVRIVLNLPATWNIAPYKWLLTPPWSWKTTIVTKPSRSSYASSEIRIQSRVVYYCEIRIHSWSYDMGCTVRSIKYGWYLFLLK